MKFYLIVFIFLSIIAKGSENPLFEVHVNKTLLGTLIEAKAIDTSINKCKTSLYLAFREIERIDSLYSTRKGSYVYEININSGLKPIKVSREFYDLIDRSIKYSEKYNGLFDISVGPLTDLWGFSNDDKPKLPDESEIKALLPLVNYKNIILDNSDTSVFLKVKGMKIDLGGIAKGFAVDKAVEIMNKRGVANFFINAGGDLVAKGRNIDGLPWRIGIKHPRLTDSVIASFESENICVATSGDYERFIEINGIRYHHILIPSTGYPGKESQSVTVVFNSVEEGTILSKYIFLLGYKAFEKLGFSNDYFIVDINGNTHFNKNFKINLKK
jgi:thiamine biosynthesis lipoprotein